MAVNIDEMISKLRLLIETIETTRASSGAPEQRDLIDALLKDQVVAGDLILSSSDSKTFLKIVSDLYEIVIRKEERLSLAAIESLVLDAIVDSLGTVNPTPRSDFRNRLDDALRDLKSNLSAEAAAWTLYLEVCGLLSDGLPRKFGDVEFFSVDDARASILFRSIVSTIERTKNTAAEKAEIALLNRSLIQGKMFGRTYAKVSIKAIDHGAATLLAEKKLRRTLDVLNFYIAAYGNPNTWLYLPGDMGPTRSVTLLFHANISRSELSTRGPVAPFSFIRFALRGVENLGFEKGASILANENRNSLERRVLAGIQWAGRAAIETRREVALLLSVIALESLVLKNQNSELRYRFSSRGAHLLARDPRNRSSIFNLLKEVYDKRSEIVHSGQTQVSLTEMRGVRTLVRDAFMTVLTEEPFVQMTREDEFDEWLDNRVLGIPPDSKSN